MADNGQLQSLTRQGHNVTDRTAPLQLERFLVHLCVSIRIRLPVVIYHALHRHCWFQQVVLRGAQSDAGIPQVGLVTEECDSKVA